MTTDTNPRKNDGLRANPDIVLYDDRCRCRKLGVPDNVVLVIVHDECVVANKAMRSNLDRSARGNGGAIIDKCKIADFYSTVGVCPELYRYDCADKAHPMANNELSFTGDVKTSGQTHGQRQSRLSEQVPLSVQDAGCIRYSSGEIRYAAQQLLHPVSRVQTTAFALQCKSRSVRIPLLWLNSANAG